MREPYVELGIAIIGQAIRDWRLESKALNYDTRGNTYIRNIASFLESDFAEVCLSQVDLKGKILLERLQNENEVRRKKLEEGRRKRCGKG